MRERARESARERAGCAARRNLSKHKEEGEGERKERRLTWKRYKKESSTKKWGEEMRNYWITVDVRSALRHRVHCASLALGVLNK